MKGSLRAPRTMPSCANTLTAGKENLISRARRKPILAEMSDAQVITAN